MTKQTDQKWVEELLREFHDCERDQEPCVITGDEWAAARVIDDFPRPRTSSSLATALETLDSLINDAAWPSRYDLNAGARCEWEHELKSTWEQWFVEVVAGGQKPELGVRELWLLNRMTQTLLDLAEKANGTWARHTQMAMEHHRCLAEPFGSTAAVTAAS